MANSFLSAMDKKVIYLYNKNHNNLNYLVHVMFGVINKTVHVKI